MEKKYKKKLQNKDLLFFLNFFSSKPRILVRGKIPVKKKTPFVVTLGQPRIISYHMKKVPRRMDQRRSEPFLYDKK